ncbi:MAG TPA: histidine kinase [Blastocatellia bacterium]|nr:histidine kinase [Blastocatellia bacterium]
MRLEPLPRRLPSFWTLQIVGWAAYYAMIVITFLPVLSAEGSLLRLMHIKLVRSLIGFCLSSVLRLIYKQLAPGRSVQFIVLLALACSVVFGCVWTALGNLHVRLTSPTFELEAALAKSPRDALDYASTLLGWSALYFGIKYWQAWQAERERALKANALAHQAQLDMLRYQLNPHFLFNALNSIRASIDEDGRRAKRMITELAEFLRYSLLNKNSEPIPLRNEIEAIRNYLAIEKIRFEDRLDVAFAIEPAAEEYRLPGFLIHPLVENAIKHGMNSASPLRIRLTARARNGSLVVEVANTGRWLPHPAQTEANANGTGTGLENVRQRLAQLFPGRSRLNIHEDDGWVRAVIEINN